MDVFKANEKLTPYFESSAGFVFFNEVFKGGLKVGGAYGLGQVYKLENDTQTNVGSCKMIQVSLGWQIGGQILSEIVFFEDPKDMERFMSGQTFEYSADASAVALEASASAMASTMGEHASRGMKTDEISIYKPEPVYNKGLAAFSVRRKGLMLEAALAVRRLSFEANPPETEVGIETTA